MRFIDFTKLGGFRLKQSVLDRMQKAYFEILYTLIAHLGVVYQNLTIISGCNIDGNFITEGVMFIDGDLCKFERVEGTLDSKIIKNVIVESNNFKDGSGQNVYRTTIAGVDLVDGTPLVDFARIENFKSLTWDNITNKPAGEMLFVAFKGSFTKNYTNSNYGFENRTITFPTIGTSNYMILQTSKTTSGGVVFPGQFRYDSLTQTSFLAVLPALSEPNGNVTVKFDFILIKLN